MKNKAIFFDRDDTLLVDTNYMHKVEDLKYIDGVFATLREVQNRGYLIFIVTNQSGIGRGYFVEEQMHRFHEKMLEGFSSEQIKIEDIVFCPHAPEDNCDCRKPSPKLINQLCDKYQIDPAKSYMVGDKTSDVLAGENAGMSSVGINCEAKNKITKIEEILDLI